MSNAEKEVAFVSTVLTAIDAMVARAKEIQTELTAVADELDFAAAACEFNEASTLYTVRGRNPARRPLDIVIPPQIVHSQLQILRARLIAELHTLMVKLDRVTQ